MIKLKYNEGRYGLWQIQPISVKELPKEISFDTRFTHLNVDFRRIVARLLNHPKYKKVMLEYGNIANMSFTNGCIFKCSIANSEKSEYLLLANHGNALTRASIWITENFRNNGNGTFKDNLVKLVQQILREDLKNVTPVEFRSLNGNKDAGIAVETIRGELVMRIFDRGAAYDDGRLGTELGL